MFHDRLHVFYSIYSTSAKNAKNGPTMGTSASAPKITFKSQNTGPTMGMSDSIARISFPQDVRIAYRARRNQTISQLKGAGTRALAAVR